MSGLAEKVIVSISGISLNDVRHEVNRAIGSGAKNVEVRLDYIQDLQTVVTNFPILRGVMRHPQSIGHPEVTQIITLRSVAQSGGNGGFRVKGYSDNAPQVAQHRMGYIQQAMKFNEECGKHFIFDIEEEDFDKIDIPHGLRILASHHNFKETPNDTDLSKVYSSLIGKRTSAVKIVTMANDYEDSLRMLRLVQEHKESGSQKELIALCMGSFGTITRVLSPLFGAAYTFACLSGNIVAPGQLGFTETVRTMHEAKHYDLKHPSKMSSLDLENISRRLGVHYS